MTRAVAPLLGTGLALVLIAASTQGRVPRLLWNASASLPIGLYALEPQAPLALGGLVAVRLPKELAAWAVSRGYLGAQALLLKRVAALPGTLVCRSGAVIRIVGVPVAVAPATDSLGRPMPDWQGCRRLEDGQVFLLLAETPDSLDGRYLGPTETAAIVARARPVWTRGG